MCYVLFFSNLPLTSSHLARKPDEVMRVSVWNRTVRDGPELVKGPGMELPQYLQEKES